MASDNGASYRVVEPELDATTLLTAAIMGFEGSSAYDNAEAGNLDSALRQHVSIDNHPDVPVYSMAADGTMVKATRVRRDSNA